MSDSAQHKIIIITAPSGAGKPASPVIYWLRIRTGLPFLFPQPPGGSRGTEQNGVDYYFISQEHFTDKIKHDEFVEWEMVYKGKYYGTLKSELQRIWNENKIPVLDIDVKGAIHIQQQFRETTLSIFIEPPSINELQRRLTSRGTESEESLQARVSKASYELSFKPYFNAVIVNSDLTQACAEAEKVVSAYII